MNVAASHGGCGAAFGRVWREDAGAKAHGLKDLDAVKIEIVIIGGKLAYLICGGYNRHEASQPRPHRASILKLYLTCCFQKLIVITGRGSWSAGRSASRGLGVQEVVDGGPR
jgi:hypothetical protein